MNYSNELMAWDCVSVRVTGVRHGLLINDQTEETDENNMFLFVSAKRGLVWADGTTYAVHNHMMFHIGRKCRIALSAEGEMEYDLVTYQYDYPQYAGRGITRLLAQDSPFDQFCAVRLKNAALVAWPFRRMLEAWRTNKPQRSLSLRSAFYAVVERFYAELLEADSTKAKPDAVEQTISYLEKHFAEPNSIQALADAAEIGRVALYRRFKERMGQSPQQYLMDLRLDAAGRMLIKSEQTHQQIAVACGLIDKDYFSRVFKKKYGMPPGAYRKQFTMRQANETLRVPRERTPLIERERRTVLIENLGRMHRYTSVPQRYVCLNYSVAEICAALGVGDRMVGLSGAEGALRDCRAAYRKMLAQVPYLKPRSQAYSSPGFEAVCEKKPELVLGSSYSFDVRDGVAEGATFEHRGIHIYALKSTYTLGGTFEDTYEDIRNIGRIFGKDKQASALIAAMRKKEERLFKTVCAQEEPVRVFSFDTVIQDRVLTCGCSLESHLIRSAGGRNVFENRARQFAVVSWQEVAEANPQVILIHRFFDGDDGEQKKRLLMSVPQLRDVEAVRRRQIHIIGLKKVFPGVDNVDTAIQLSQWLKEARDTKVHL